MKYILFRLKRFCGFIAGFVFFIAGILKLLDPVGTGLIMKEYFDFLHIGFMSFIAKFSGVAFALLETIIGTALITGVWRKLTAIAALVFQGAFTALTLALLIFNPEMDCGCFGEAIHLTHLQTFIKNIILMLMLVAFAFPIKHLGWPRKRKYVAFSVVTTSVIAFTAYSWVSIPLVEFTEFRPAVSLQAGNAFQPEEDEDMFEAIFVYEKEGRKEEFTLENLPDSTWTFIETRSSLKNEGELSSVNLSFYNKDGEYCDTLATTGKVMVVSVYDTGIKASAWKKVAAFMATAQDAGFKTLLLVSSPSALAAEAGIPEDLTFVSDYKTLITMNRSNGGVTYFSDGYLISKWAARNVPDTDSLAEIFSGDETETIIEKSTNGSLAFQGFMLYVFAIMLLL